MKQDSAAVLMIASSEGDSNMLYATKFFVPDPFIFMGINGKKIVIMSDLEVDRAKSQAKVDEVLSYSRLAEELKKKGSKTASYVDVIDHLLKEHGVKQIKVPGNFSVEYADRFRERGYELTVKSDPFFEERTVKTDDEIREITQTLRHTEAAIQEAVNVIKQAEIRGNEIHYNGKALTSEDIKKIINVELMKRDCLASHTIVASGLQGCDPHNEGSGPLVANSSIIMDVFPHSMKTHYFADITRTVCRGKAPDKLKRMFDAVHEGQKIGFRMVKEGADGYEVHSAIMKRFEELGFKTGEMNGRMQGFFHGTGHGLGLDVHEPPRIGMKRDILKKGHVVTVEPGLYYHDAGGGIRLEDLVVVTETGNRNLTEFPIYLEV